jgi:hypothetical protein
MPNDLTIRNHKNGLSRSVFLKTLAATDTRGMPYSDDLLRWCTSTLNGIFFFGAIKDLDVSWNVDILEHDNAQLLGLATPITREGTGLFYPRISINPLRSARPRSEHARTGQTLAEEKLGTILHEMVNVFLQQYNVSAIRCVLY